jgi:hypothetical protein
LPHSGIPGSKHARCSPGHFAVRRALLRLLAPRHPPAALCSLIIPNRLVISCPATFGGLLEMTNDWVNLRRAILVAPAASHDVPLAFSLEDSLHQRASPHRRAPLKENASEKLARFSLYYHHSAVFKVSANLGKERSSSSPRTEGVDDQLRSKAMADQPLP